MKIVVAMDKFKGCLGSHEITRVISQVINHPSINFDIDLCPVSDGGEGLVQTLIDASGGRLSIHRVTGPLPEMRIDARVGILGDGQTAVIEMASASGLHLLRPDQYNPLATTTFGTGELINAAVRAGCQRIILGIGGSATCDGGVGCAQACGKTIILEDGEPVHASEPLCGRDVGRVVLIKSARGGPAEGAAIHVACDVNNPLLGPHGAAQVYGPQKGATPEHVEHLERNLRRLAERTGLLPLAERPGAGAAGGLGFGLMAFFGATLQPGAALVLEALRLRQRLAGADLCITGEGCLDEQSLQGKAPIAVARLCSALGVACVAIAGQIKLSRAQLAAEGIEEAWSLQGTDSTTQQSIHETPARLRHIVERGLMPWISMRLKA